MLKQSTYLFFVIILMSACSISRVGPNKPNDSQEKANEKRSLRFLQNITVNPSIDEPEFNSPDVTRSYPPNARINTHFNGNYFSLSNIENSNWLQFKFAIIMKVAVEDLTNIRLLNFMDEWYSTRYKYGGSSKSGIDCSAFTSSLLTNVYGISVPRTSREQYKSSQKIKKSELKEGDLVFFNTRRGVSHVGVYLTNNKFIHASSSNGVMISDLDEEYFSRRYVGAGRPVTTTP